MEVAPPFGEPVTVDIDNQTLPQLCLHQNVRIDNDLLDLPEYYVLQVGKGSAHAHQESQAVQIVQLRVLQRQLLQRWNHLHWVLHEVLNAIAQVDCLNGKQAELRELLPVYLGEGVHEEVVLSDDQLLQVGKFVCLEEGVEGLGGQVEADLQHPEHPEVHQVELLHPARRELGKHQAQRQELEVLGGKVEDGLVARFVVV